MTDAYKGLIDGDEKPEQTAVRELKEETGYVGEVIKATELMYCDPGLSSANMKAVYVKIDMNNSVNKNPRPELDEGEYIETFTLPLKNLYQSLNELAEQGHTIDARLMHFAMGLDVASTLN